MTQTRTKTRPDYIGPDWLRCTDGMAFSSPPPQHLRADETLSSPNPWARIVCVTLQAQAGDFRNVPALLELARWEDDDQARDCAITIFGFAAPSAVAEEIVQLFDHPDHDTRMEAYGAARCTGLPRLSQALARHRGRYGRVENEYLMDHISEILEPDQEDLELVDSPLDDEAYVARVDQIVDELERRHGAETALQHGEPLEASKLAAQIAERCAEDEPEYSGGMIASLFAQLEGMTGWSYAGCLNDDCEPDLPKISHTLNSLRQSGILDRFEPGRRYFFGHLLP